MTVHRFASCDKRVLVVGAATLAAALLASAPTADAGTPYWCACRGKDKRYIASTHYCEVRKFELTHAKSAEIPAGWVMKHPCSEAEQRRWRLQACREMGCSLPKP